MIDKRFSLGMPCYSLSMMMLMGYGYEVYMSCCPHIYAGIMNGVYSWNVQAYYGDSRTEYMTFDSYREAESWLKRKGYL